MTDPDNPQGGDVDWFKVMAEAIEKVDAGLYQTDYRRSRNDLIATACAEAVEKRLPIHDWLQAQSAASSLFAGSAVITSRTTDE